MDSPAMPDPAPAPASARMPRLRRIVRPLVWVAFALALYAVAGFFAVPLFARYQVTQALSDLLGRDVRIEKVAFNPFTLTAELRDLKIMGNEAGEARPALAFDRLMADFEIISLWYGGPVVREVALEGPRLRLTRLSPERYDVSDVLDRLSGHPSAQPEEGKLLPFSVANIHIEHGQIEVEDRVANVSHSISELKLGIPAISMLPVAVDVSIEPDLSLLLDGQPLAAKGRLEPTQDGFRGVLEQLTLKDFDLSPWLAYLPSEPTFRLPSGTLDLDLRVEFEQRKDETPKVVLRGRAQANNLAIQDRAGAPVLAATELEVELAEIQPLIGRYYFSKLRLQQPELHLVRLEGGDFNITRLLPAPVKQQKNGARKERTAKAAESAKKNTETPLNFLLSSARIRDGLVHYGDHTVPGSFSSRIEGINLDLRDLSNDSGVPAQIRLDYTTAAGEKFSHQDRLRLKPFEYVGNLTIEGLQPALYGRYYASFLPGGEIRRGHAGGVFHYRIATRENKAGNAGDADELQTEIGIERLTLSDFVLGLAGRKSELLKLESFAVTDAEILPDVRQIRIGSVETQSMVLSVMRLSSGKFDFMTLAGKPSPSSRKASAPWTFRLERLAAAGTSLRFEDRAADEPAVMNFDGLELRLTDLSTAKGAKPASLTTRGRFNKDGHFAAKGTFVPESLRTDLEVDLQNIGLPAVQPYIAHRAQLGIKSGKLSVRGQVAFRQQRDKLFGSLNGNIAVRDFSSINRHDDSEFVRWREFAVRQARVELEPFALAIGEIAFDGLNTRLILDERGRLNLREIQRSPPQALQTAEAPEATEAPEAAEATPEAVVEAEADGRLWPPVNVGRVSLKDSNIAFSDRFVRPNYNAFLGNLSGELTGLSSDQTSLAKLDLQGRIGRTAPLTIKGEFNPFRQDHHLNIEAEVKDFELTGLSGYSGRYIGYGISRGKLSATLNYQIEDRKLTAKNRVFLDKLTFGDAVDSPEATHLPVRLAVSLLKNSRGEIDINLPVGGTLDDPQFSVFGLVLRALGGLIAKAVTAPFALLGREELSFVDFDPGSAQIGAAQEEKLRELAKALEDRPSLKLDITGLSSAERDADGVRRNKLRNMIVAEKRKATGKGGRDSVELSDEEVARYLGAVYSEAKIKKPRNFIGLTKNLPVGEMETLLLASIDVGEEDINALALRRETAVQRWLFEQGKIALERLFLRAPAGDEHKEGRKGSGARFSLR